MRTPFRHMSLPGVWISILVFMGTVARAQISSPNRLSSRFPPEILKDIILTVDEWHPFPKYEERRAWENLPDILKDDFIHIGESALKKKWPHLPASLYLDYIRNGNRSRYEHEESTRKLILLDLVMAELVEGRGRFLDSIIDAVWSVCEQSTWTLPAHVKTGLPDVEKPVVALRSGETGAMLSWIYYLFKQRFNTISPRINQRIIFEIERRIISPCFERDDFWWFGFEGDHINNWNPWCNSNWLTCLLITEPDSARKYQSIHKSLRSLDRFLDSRPPDGGCDEGPGYWNHSAGTLFIALEMLYGASAGKINIFQDPLVRNLGEYLPKVHINGSYFVNFADASAQISVEASLLNRYGKAVHSEAMMALSREAVQEGFNSQESRISNIYRKLMAIFAEDELRSNSSDSDVSLDAYLPDIQVITSRSSFQKDKGLFLAAKGGNNAESHNHNDVGNFIIYKDGRPYIIDVGVETYTRKTFGSDRYQIWTMNSDYHNLPSINGVKQMNGKDYRAKDVTYRQGKEGIEFSLDIAGAYPEEAAVRSWKRTFVFARNRSVEVIDEYGLDSYKQPVVLHLMSAREPRIESSGEVQLGAQEENSLTLKFPPGKFRCEVETIDLTDVKLKKVWGDMIYRINLISKSEKREDAYRIIFE
jgi:hypothetical protein